MSIVMMAGILSVARKIGPSISGGRSTSSTNSHRHDVIEVTTGKMSKVGLKFGLHVPLITYRLFVHGLVFVCISEHI